MNLQAAYNSLVKMAQKVTLGMQRILASNNIKDRSGIYGKTDLKVIINNNRLVIQSQLPDYAPFVKYGRGPGKQPPYGNILEWIHKKGLDENSVFPIARSIAKKGTKQYINKKVIDFDEPLRRMIALTKDTLKIEAIEQINEELNQEIDLIPKNINITI